MRHEFQVHLLNESGVAQATELGEVFSKALDDINKLVPVGRELSIVITKLQEALFFAKRAIAMAPENQK